MRISTSTLYDVNVASLNLQQAKMTQTQQQVAAGRRIMTPADDPAGAALALNVSQADSANTQYGSNIDRAQTSLALSEGILQSVTSLLQDVHTTAVNAGNIGTLSNSDRKALAADLQGRLDELGKLANTTDASGNYLFAGFQARTPPFVVVNTPTGVQYQYQGDDGQRMIQVSPAAQVAVTDSGADIFSRIKNGNGIFVTQADPTSNGGLGNAGTGKISIGSMRDPSPANLALLSNKYKVNFTVASGVTTYGITDVTTGLPVTDPAQVPPLVASPPGNAYVSGQEISFNGVQIEIQGAPANGDAFIIEPSTNEDIFSTISNLISALNTPLVAGDAAGSTQLSAKIGVAINGLDRGLDNVLTIRASMGSRLRGLDSEKSTVEDLGIQYKQLLSQLQDLDYNRAISDLTQQKMTLEASQKSFNLVSGLSMFDYM